ncbi:TetR/AcrR family transcriptional regulator [Halodesulfovibrio spirochaetisodalis]|uniref:TetR family transcriptional regulator n=1 Tax=Halodesulfovibrio spirochaetisodalis TaxID=1560234 RepID=A0A1B7XD78_9BACT|nr:TetR/AcrR family transcriptional regulator [Halodesulfovibrio spirochaetisodalis]OBQ51891.1 TetR family transcriptional regulator [Halodesulfovibrio spirochaetisodalis]
MDKRQLIIEAAIELFCLNGFDKTSTSAICTKANVSKGLVFHHFKNKNELLREAFATIATVVEEVSGKIDMTGQPKDRLLSLINTIFDSMAQPEHRRLYQFNFNVMMQPSTREIIADLIAERSQFQRGIVGSIFSAISEENSHIRSLLFIAEIDGIAMHYLFSEEEFPLDLIREQFIKKYCEP